jgi:hypothetical protein
MLARSRWWRQAADDTAEAALGGELAGEHTNPIWGARFVAWTSLGRRAQCNELN